MEYFGIKYVVRSNVVKNNTLATLVTLLILWNNSDSRLVLAWGMTALEFIEVFVCIDYHYCRPVRFFNIDSAVLSPDMFPSDPFPQLVNLAEQSFLVPGQGFGYIYTLLPAVMPRSGRSLAFLSICFLQFV